MKRLHFAFLCLVAVAVTGCPPQGGAANGKYYRIGVAAPLTGSGAAFGEQIRDAAALKIAEVNAAGGIRGKKVQAVYEDDRADATEAANVSRKLAADKSICLVIGHFNSVCSNAAKEEYNRKGVVQFSPGSTNVDVCRGYPWTFRNLYRDDYQGTFLAHYAKQVIGGHKAAVFYENDDYGKGLMQSFTKAAKKIGLQTLSPISFVRERTQDFEPLVEQIKDKHPDVIFIAGLYNEGALITKAARNDLGIKAPILGGDGLMNDAFIKTAGKAAEGCYVTCPFLFEAAKDNPKAKVFFQAFKKKYHKEPDTWAALTYDAVGMALQGIKAVGGNRKKIRDWFASRTTPAKGYRGVTGLTYFDKNGDCYSKGAHVAMVKDGKFVAAPKQLKLAPELGEASGGKPAEAKNHKG